MMKSSFSGIYLNDSEKAVETRPRRYSHNAVTSAIATATTPARRP